MAARALRVFFVLAALATASTSAAQPESSPSVVNTAPRASQGVAVLATAGARDDAFTLARAVYGSSLRPRHLDELRARILAGDPAPSAATKEVRELAELRASISSEDAASRRLLSSIAQQIGVRALLVVSRGPAARAEEAAEEKGTTAIESDAGPAASPAVPSSAHVTARLFLAGTGEFDAARYEPESIGPGEALTWRGTVASLSGRFPPPPTAATAQLQGAPPKLSSEGKESKPFYLSPWLWGAVGAAALLGAFFFFTSQDNSSDPIHLQMRVPR